ncbi:MAG: hypothetical protein EXR69_12620 [Myxococcales bacterium]|nr:hypothetical protein [Myxococcales bacterium]
MTFVAYVGCIWAGYVWDDEALILLNRALTAPTVRTVLGSDLWCCSGTDTSGYWRPLTTLSFYADVALFGFQPAWAHLHSLGWHLLCTGLLGALVGRRHGAARGALASMILGIHPVVSEAVVWIAARNDLLAAAFVLGALLVTDKSGGPASGLRARGAAIRPIAVGFCALGAALSKESSVLLPLLLVLWIVAHDGLAGARLRWREVAASALGLGVAFGLRQLAVVGTLTDFHRVPLQDPLALLAAIARMLGWISWPWPLTGTATLYLPHPEPIVWVSAAVTLAAAGVATQRAPRFALALLGFTLTAAAPMTAALYVYGTLGERYLYLPMVGVATLAAAQVRLTPAPLGVTALWAAGALLTLHVRLPDWVSPTTFFEAAVRRAPDSFSWNLYGVDLAKQGDPAGAVEAFERSLASRPSRRFACTRIASSAVAVLNADAYAQRLPDWRAAGCGELRDFEFQVAWSLARLGDEARALDVVRAAGGDSEGVAAAVEAAAAQRAGDIVGAAGLLGAADDLDQARSRFSTLLALRTARPE